MGLPGESKPARFEPLEWPIETEEEEESETIEKEEEKEPAKV
jgi:hypothetical protein